MLRRSPADHWARSTGRWLPLGVLTDRIAGDGEPITYMCIPWLPAKLQFTDTRNCYEQIFF